MPDPLTSEFNYFLANRTSLQRRYRGKFIVIKDCKVEGSFKSELEAVKAGLKKFAPGTFLVQECAEGDTSFRGVFHSRVSFA